MPPIYSKIIKFMDDFILGIGVTILFFAFIHIAEKYKKSDIDDLNDEEKKWLKNN